MNTFKLLFLAKTCFKMVVRGVRSHSFPCRYLLTSITVLNDITINFTILCWISGNPAHLSELFCFFSAFFNSSLIFLCVPYIITLHKSLINIHYSNRTVNIINDFYIIASYHSYVQHKSFIFYHCNL